MAGVINIVDTLYVPAQIKFIGETSVIGNVTASMYSGSGRGLFDIPQSSLSSEVFRLVNWKYYCICNSTIWI